MKNWLQPPLQEKKRKQNGSVIMFDISIILFIVCENMVTRVFLDPPTPGKPQKQISKELYQLFLTFPHFLAN